MADQFEDDEDRSLSITLDHEAERSKDQPENRSVETAVGDQGAAEEADAKRRPQVSGYPDELERRYYVITEKNGEVHRVYADSQGAKEIFRDYGDELRTKQADPDSVRLMMETAQHRGWDSLKLSGAKEFRREAWLEASARGIAVRGYEPTELDRQELARREQAFMKNEIRRNPTREVTPDGKPTDRAASVPTAPATEAAQLPSQVNYRVGVEGVLLDAGSRPYKDNPDAQPSPYVELQLANGDRHTAWGVGLPDALEKAGVEKGDRISIRETGIETVTKTIPREIDGKTVLMEANVQRRGWETHKLERQEERQAEAAVHSIGGAQNSLHTGPGREVAFEGTGANEERAKDFLMQGRMASAGTPELRGAVALENYVERKLQRDFGHNPALVARGMNAARHKIAHMISRGVDFPKPRVTDERAKQLDKNGDATAKTPEQKQEQDRAPDRER